MPKAWAVHDAATGDLVGFVMISDNIPEPMDDDLVGPYFLWKLLIDGPRCSDSPARPFFDAETLDGGWAMAPPDGLWGAKSKGSTPSRGTRLLDAAVARSCRRQVGDWSRRFRARGSRVSLPPRLR